MQHVMNDAEQVAQATRRQKKPDGGASPNIVFSSARRATVHSGAAISKRRNAWTANARPGVT